MNRQSSYRTPQKRSNNSQSKPATPLASPVNNSSTNPLYFCHYKNAMYMGGIKSFKKDGKGILLHDGGLSILSSYFNDQMHGHNIFFAQHCLLSAEFSKGKLVQAVYRTDGFLSHFFFNNDEQLQGKCKLLNFTNRSITYAVFKKGIMSQKSEQTQAIIINRVFDLRELEFMIGKTHASALKYQIQKVNNIVIQKYGNKLVCGFDKNGLINGLGFTIVFRGSHGGYNPDTLRLEDQFELKVIQRGFLQNSMLNGFGQKLFKNGNLYIGEFKSGVFQGNGVLINQAKKNWVSGYFQKGNLIQMFEYNNEGMEKRYDKIIEALHEKKTNWINNQITTLSLSQFDRLMQKLIDQVPASTVKGLQQRKLQVLKRIQQNFVCDTTSVPSFLQNAKNDLKFIDNQKQRTRESMKKFVQSFTPQIQTTSPRNPEADIQNQQSTVKIKQPYRKVTDIRKSKIFQKTTSSDRYLRIDSVSASRNRSSRLTPQTKKKIFNTTSTGYKFRPNATVNSLNSPENVESRGNDQPPKEWGENSSQVHQGEISQQKNQEQSKPQSRTAYKKDISKSKIFDVKEKHHEEAPPKFIYTRVDTIPESERRKKIGLDEQG